MKLVGIDKLLSSTENGLAQRYLVLDYVPNNYWADMFLKLHKNSISPEKREVSLRGKYVIVECLVEEIQGQVNFLNKLCEEAEIQLIKAHDQEQKAKQAKGRLEEENRILALEAFEKLKF
ncbi:MULTISPECIES: hypothetical protein [Pantoea]|uniref:hypothetical protein n=1 Tax=Pantoea TaxID=53335 RepID=UPI00068E39FC|nr:MULTISPECIES: hypothetical protein [Pantoea]